MDEKPRQNRQRIGLAAFLAAFSVAALGLGWASAVTGLLEKTRAAQAAADNARAAAELARAEEMAFPTTAGDGAHTALSQGSAGMKP